jgi:DNA (cytosine-5)-methyltransferase 1
MFHGAGGSSLGAKMAGAEIVAGIDYWDVATDNYRRNFSQTKIIHGDIRAISPNKLHDAIGNIELIIASPECTNHSCAKGSAPRNEESRLTAFEVTRFAREFKPKWIIIENVVQMNSWDRQRDLLNELEGMGYFVRQEKLNAKDFGVPQTRRRLFLICSLFEEVNLSIASGGRIKPASQVIDLNGTYNYSPLYAPRRALATIARAERAISQLGNKEPFLIVYYGTDGSGGWQSIEQPLRTVTTIDRFALVKPSATGYKMRMLQPEELKLAMGFPSSYKLEAGTRRDKIKLMGNAVCPPIMRYLVRAINKNIFA